MHLAISWLKFSIQAIANYKMGSSIATELHQISTINKENDLGITFTHDFKFRSHIYKIAQKANKVFLGIIKHTYNQVFGTCYHASTVYKFGPLLLAIAYAIAIHGTLMHLLEDVSIIEKI